MYKKIIIKYLLLRLANMIGISTSYIIYIVCYKILSPLYNQTSRIKCGSNTQHNLPSID